MSTKKEAFLGGFDGDYTAVHVEMQYPGFPEPEIIYNEKANFKKKRNYYANVLNDDLSLKRSPNVKIVKYMFE